MYLRGVSEVTNPLSDFWKTSLDGIAEPEWQAMIEKGNTALQFQAATLKQGLKGAFPIDFHGHRTLALNWVLEASDMGEKIYKELGYEVALMFYFTGNIWNFSLRSEKVDVSKLALQYGGGGHPGASGFRTESVDWLLKLKKKP
jgi:oligoribonuclease NrnB/cAMP/cGMP phosphodiesterase (DHH superfamily)